eukprot:m.227661 g.227661  ORF g.227661 m.227661 type:complete len:222 (-) comp19250_c1_seq2:2292-2957(-)
MSSNGYAKTFRIVDGDAAMHTKSPAIAWLWHPSTGHLQPAASSVTMVYCVDAVPTRRIPGRSSDIPDLTHCDHRRPSQRWSFVPYPKKAIASDAPTSARFVRIVSNKSSTAGTDLCLTVAPLPSSQQQFCGSSAHGVSEWQGRLFESDATDAQSAGNASPVQRCLNVVLLPCVTDLRSSDAVDYQRWRVGPPPDYADDAAVLDGDPHPRPHDMRLRGVSLQ